MSIELKKQCSASHINCLSYINFFNKDLKTNLNTINFNKFIDNILATNVYYNCLSSYSNKKSELVINFIITASMIIVIEPIKLILISQFITSDYNLSSIIKNQIILTPNYTTLLINLNNTKQHGKTINFIELCINTNKINTLKLILEKVNVSIFIDNIIKKSFYQLTKDIENIIIKYITDNSQLIAQYPKIVNVIDFLLNKPNILKCIYNCIVHTLKHEQKLTIFNKVLTSNILDPTFILLILEGNDIIPDNNSLNSLLSKVVFKSTGAINSKIISEIIDIFVLYGFKITKDIIITLLKKGCSVNFIERHNIIVDNTILEHCADLSFYPYDFNCIPSSLIMVKECGKDNNLEKIKKLKEKGGIITIECLEKACGVKKNAKVIKYIITECNIKPNFKCLTIFQITYGIESLDLIMSNYDNTKKEIKPIQKITLDDDSIMKVEKKNIDINNNIDYLLKKKIRKILNYNNKFIKYNQLYELMLKYLINHNLIIGNYFVINNELCVLLKISQCTLLNIDQLDNILTYFIDLPV